jgi:hypothetical protein
MEENVVPPAVPTGPQTDFLKPHRGTTVLVLGIIGLACCFIAGIIAWVMGKNDMAEMDAGSMDPAGRGLTQAGKICGMISVGLQVIVLIIWLITAIIGIATGI